MPRKDFTIGFRVGVYWAFADTWQARAYLIGHPERCKDKNLSALESWLTNAGFSFKREAEIEGEGYDGANERTD